MLEYKSVTLGTRQNFITRTPKGDIDCDKLDEILNEMAEDRWVLNKIESLQVPNGTATILCIFCREMICGKPKSLKSISSPESATIQDY